jgi:hypothetical protein
MPSLRARVRTLPSLSFFADIFKIKIRNLSCATELKPVALIKDPCRQAVLSEICLAEYFAATGIAGHASHSAQHDYCSMCMASGGLRKLLFIYLYPYLNLNCVGATGLPGTAISSAAAQATPSEAALLASRSGSVARPEEVSAFRMARRKRTSSNAAAMPPPNAAAASDEATGEGTHTFLHPFLLGWIV